MSKRRNRDGRWVVYANNGSSTYRVKGQPPFSRADEIKAIEWAKEYGRTYDEVTTVVYVGGKR